MYSLTLSGLLIFAFLFWLLWGIFTGRLVYRFTGIEVGLAVFGVAAVVSAWGASDKRAAITQTAACSARCLPPCFWPRFWTRPAKIRVVLAVVVGLGVVSAYECAEQFFISNSITIEQYEKNPQGPARAARDRGRHVSAFPVRAPALLPGRPRLLHHEQFGRFVRHLGLSAAAILLIRRLRDCKTRRKSRPRYGLFAGLAGLVVMAGLLPDTEQRRHPGVLCRPARLRAAAGLATVASDAQTPDPDRTGPIDPAARCRRRATRWSTTA